MAKFLVQANYTLEGRRGLAKEGAVSRRAAIDKLIQSMGGTLEAFYFAFGETDVFCVIDLPDNVSAAATSIAVNLGGGATSRVTVLLMPDEVDRAMTRLPAYRAPGQS